MQTHPLKTWRPPMAKRGYHQAGQRLYCRSTHWRVSNRDNGMILRQTPRLHDSTTGGDHDLRTALLHCALSGITPMPDALIERGGGNGPMKPQQPPGRAGATSVRRGVDHPPVWKMRVARRFRRTSASAS